MSNKHSEPKSIKEALIVEIAGDLPIILEKVESAISEATKLNEQMVTERRLLQETRDEYIKTVLAYSSALKNDVAKHVESIVQNNLQAPIPLHSKESRHDNNKKVFILFALILGLEVIQILRSLF